MTAFHIFCKINFFQNFLENLANITSSTTNITAEQFLGGIFGANFNNTNWEEQESDQITFTHNLLETLSTAAAIVLVS